MSTDDKPLEEDPEDKSGTSPFCIFIRFLSASLLFHKFTSWTTLPWLLEAWAYFFIWSNIVVTTLVAIVGISMFFLVQNPIIHSTGFYDREQFRDFENDTVSKNPFNHLLIIPMIIVGINLFGFPGLSLVFCAVYALERIAQYNFACLMTKFDVEE